MNLFDLSGKTAVVTGQDCPDLRRAGDGGRADGDGSFRRAPSQKEFPRRPKA
jgi:hypothetical protein